MTLAIFLFLTPEAVFPCPYEPGLLVTFTEPDVDEVLT